MKKITITETEVSNLLNDMDLGAYTRGKMNDLPKDNVIYVKRRFFLTEKANDSQQNQILFSSDGKAWISDGYNSFRVFYNPFDGSMLKLEKSEDYDYLPGYLIGKKINNVNIDKNRIIFLLSEGEFALFPTCKESFIGNINIEKLDTLVERVVTQIDFHVDNIYQKDKTQGILNFNLRTWGADYKVDWVIKDSNNCSLNLEKLS